MASCPITSRQIDVETVSGFFWAPVSLQMMLADMKLNMLPPWKDSYNQPRQHIKKKRHYFANKGPSSQGYSFPGGHVWMWYLEYKESWVLTNWSFWALVLEKTLESPLDCREIQPVHPRGDQSWVFIGRTDVEAETPIFWPPDEKSWLIWKDSDAWKDWRQVEKRMAEDEMVGWHHWLDGHEFGWTPGGGDGQGGLACCSSWGCKESDMTEQLNWIEFLWEHHYTPFITMKRGWYFAFSPWSVYLFDLLI